MKHIVLPRRVRRTPTVTVVMPCYKYGRFLRSAVRSALDQSRVDVRVLIVDDASPDDSAEVAQRLAAEDPRVRVLVHEVNRGHIQTYNDGFALVDTDYVTLVSADDIVAPGSLDRAISLMERYPRVGLVYGAIATFADDADQRPKRSRWYHLWRVWGQDEWIDAVARSGYNPIASPEAVVRTAALREVGGYNPALPHTGDLEYWLRIAAHWQVGEVHGPVQAYYRVHGANMHLKDFGTREVDLRERFAAFCVLRDAAVQSGLPRASQHLDTARQAILAQVDALIAEERAAGTSTASLEAFQRELADGRAPRPTNPVSSES
ncbi:glycosyltransferase [Microbacterium yannicii]|uniref:Glycosyltransferase n=1 Tax=Microbacterium yannicii TaxID=671622 RepID=A0ABP9LUU1_9MICO|nr:glycosyltransferase family 2 protein [Microbacterium yannicii]MCO5952323.1 glycosyltransferase [Microbacterium yannicii]